jgi:hypothetical protein
MATTTYSGKEPSGIDTKADIEPRTRRACEQRMQVVPEGDCSGRFEVYSANDDEATYVVDLRTKTCDCPDAEYHSPAGGCKHVRRVKLGLGLMDVPAGVDVDGWLALDRMQFGADVDRPDENHGRSGVPDAHSPDSGGQEAVADGGQLIEAPDNGVVLDDDDEKEGDDHDHNGELRSETHTIALDAYDASPLPDFDVFGEIVACSADSVRRAIETETGK